MMAERVCMLDIREDLLTQKLHHIADSKVQQVRYDWLHTQPKDDTDINALTQKAGEWFLSSRRNKVDGIDHFKKLDIIYGCTDYINSFLMKEKTYQILEKDYSYYRLFGQQESKVGDLQSNVPIIVSLPNWHFGNSRPDWKEFLDECESKNISIHLDAAWFTATKDMSLDVGHPNIKTVAFSITKTGFQWNKFGIRFSKQKTIDSITVRNANGWINKNTTNCANFILDNISVDHAWDRHEQNYNVICDKLALEKTNFIHVAKKNGKSVGVAGILNQC
jgi:hypothetical protein